MNGSQDGSPTSQACGVQASNLLSPCQASSIAQPSPPPYHCAACPPNLDLLCFGSLAASQAKPALVVSSSSKEVRTFCASSASSLKLFLHPSSCISTPPALPALSPPYFAATGVGGTEDVGLRVEKRAVARKGVWVKRGRPLDSRFRPLQDHSSQHAFGGKSFPLDDYESRHAVRHSSRLDGRVE
ncbi:unnamed protein product [Rangifer tarandus platyrhynchus]|uniref:Uncharacterized protein n=1 Tax=Rangifer tarandus platyrhynchus TaxID=3082113 RepID=A0AC59Z8K3_RANTA